MERKKRKASQNIHVKNVENIANNLKAVPENCRHLVQEGDVLYVVPGDGCCGPNCTAALLFHDEVFGPKLRRRMNLFFANHWNRRYQHISQCSPGHPYKRKIKDGEIEFTDPDQLIKFLKHSSDAAYMWSDSEDLAVISDMFQLRIKVISTKGLEDNKPTVNWIYPDESLKEFAELKDVKLNDMVLLHESDSHFNLVISKDSDLAKLGCLSDRFGVGPIGRTKVDEYEIDVEEETAEIEEDDLAKVKKELKKLKQRNEFIETEYVKCEKTA